MNNGLFTENDMQRTVLDNEDSSAGMVIGTLWSVRREDTYCYAKRTKGRIASEGGVKFIGVFTLLLYSHKWPLCCVIFRYYKLPPRVALCPVEWPTTVIRRTILHEHAVT